MFDDLTSANAPFESNIPVSDIRMKNFSNVLVLTFAFSSANANYFVPTCSNSADYTSWGGEVDLITSNPHVNIGPKDQKYKNMEI